MKAWIPSTLIVLLVAGIADGQIDRRPQGGRTPRRGRASTQRFVAPPPGLVTLRRRTDDSALRYLGATTSFEYGVQGNERLTSNDWDICLQGLGDERSPFELEPRTVVDDRSDLFDLGVCDFEKVTPTSAAKALPRNDRQLISPSGLAPIAGHVYLLHTRDDDSDFWTKFEIVEVRPADSVKLRWQLLTEPQRLRPNGLPANDPRNRPRSGKSGRPSR